MVAANSRYLNVSIFWTRKDSITTFELLKCTARPIDLFAICQDQRDTIILTVTKEKKAYHFSGSTIYMRTQPDSNLNLKAHRPNNIRLCKIRCASAAHGGASKRRARHRHQLRL